MIAVTTALIAGVVVTNAASASAQSITHDFIGVLCTSTAGNQNQDISIRMAAPDQVIEGSTFTVSFPGGDAALPAVALGGSVTITSYSNLSTTLQMQVPGTFVTGTGVADGPTTLDGTPVTATGTVIAPDKFKIAEPGPFAPGTLHTPEWSVSATVPLGTAGQSITMNAFQLTTQVRLQGFVVPVAVNCQIPTDTLLTIPIIAAGSNVPPTVSAGPDNSGDVGISIALDGTVTDPDNTPTTQWSVDSPFCTFADANAIDTTVSCTHAGMFAATLTANDGVNAPVSDAAIVTVTTPNAPPVVNAGPDVSADVNDDIDLNGTITDADSTPTAHWTIDSPNCSFSDDSVATTVLNCTSPGTFAATLTADDGINAPVTDTAQVVISAIPPGLTVSAGPAATGGINTPITLNGKVTDPGQTPTLAWSIDSPSCTFGDSAVAVTTVTCSAPGVFAATLTGHDGVNADEFDTTLVTVTSTNFSPVADAGPDISGVKNSAIALNGSVTDPDDTPSTWWTVDSPTCTVANPLAATTTITCTTPGVYAAALNADDGVNPPVNDVALVTVLDSSPPVVNAGPDTTGLIGTPIALNGSVTDADSTPTVQWATGNPNCSFGDASSAVTTITCTSGGITAATLTGADGVNPPVSDTALVNVTAPNVAPTVNAGADTSGVTNHAVPLNATVVDPDNAPNVQWATGSPNCSFANPNAIDTTIFCTTVGIFAATLTADDGVNPPVHDTALVTFSAPLCTGPCVNIGDVVTYEGGTAVVPITLSQLRPVGVKVTATIVPINATNGTGLPVGSAYDFKSAVVRNVTILANARQVNISVAAINDAIVEPDESFEIVLSSPTGGASLGRKVGIVTIKDSTGAAPGQLLVGSTSIVEPDACATCKVNASISVVTSAPVTSPVTTRFTTADAGATANLDYKPQTNVALNFNVGKTAYKPIVVVVIGDTLPESTENVNVVFSNVVGVLQPSNGVVSILDND